MTAAFLCAGPWSVVASVRRPQPWRNCVAAEEASVTRTVDAFWEQRRCQDVTVSKEFGIIFMCV